MPSQRLENDVHQRTLAMIGMVACFLLLAALVPSSVQAEDQVCSLAIDFGDHVVWADVPVTNEMNGFDVFLNATKMLDLSYSASPTPPYGHTVIRVENYSMQYDFANPKASGKLWHLWYWDAAKNAWSISNTLLDGINATSTSAILLTYHTDPWGPPTLPLEHEPSVGGESSAPTSFQYEVDGMNVAFEATNESNVTSYSWSFGDGASAEGRSVSHSYSAEGRYYVTLKLTFSEGDSKKETGALTIGSSEKELEGFPVWGWGVLALIVLGGVEIAFLYRKKVKEGE